MFITDKDVIVDFLTGKTPDYRKRYYKDIVGCDDEAMECCHDQVQWMWPLHEESNFASTYPIVTKEVIEEAKKNPEVVNNLIKAKNRMESFFAIGPYTDIQKQRKWCRPGNHNLLRITRIIRSLRLFGLDKEAEDFYLKAVQAASRFLNDNDATFEYWKKAMRGEPWETLR